MVTLISLQSGKESRERFSLRSSCRLDHLSEYYCYVFVFVSKRKKRNVPDYSSPASRGEFYPDIT